MTRAQVRSFIESGIEELSQQLSFGSGRISEFNSDRGHTYPTAWLDPLSNNPTLPNGQGSVTPQDNWNVVIHIAKKDKMDSTPEQYEAIVDECDSIGQQLQKKYNDEVEGFNLVTLGAVSREPFIKKHADCTTGIILSFTLSGPDTTNLC